MEEKLAQMEENFDIVFEWIRIWFHTYNTEYLIYGSHIFGLTNFIDFSIFLLSGIFFSVLFNEFNKYKNLFNKYISISNQRTNTIKTV